MEDTVFLWGARQTGKSTLLKYLFPRNRYYDLLKGEVYERFNRRPGLLREELMTAGENELIIIDEVQKIPALLDEVHWLITNRKLRFILCGSSARKLKRSGANLLGGRAVRNTLYPLVSPEIPAEALTRNLSTFSRFLEVAALSCGEMLNYNNIARECGVSAPTIKEFFSILEDTLVGYFLPAFRKPVKRRLIHAPRFYYFDLGLTNFLLRRSQLQPGSPEYGKAFEHFIIQELQAWSAYTSSTHELWKGNIL